MNESIISNNVLFPKISILHSHFLILHRFLERECRIVIYNHIIFWKLYGYSFVLLYIVHSSQSSLSIQREHRYANHLKITTNNILIVAIYIPSRLT
jgi:hypothetical protein